LFPEKAPKEWKDKTTEIVRSPPPKAGHEVREENIMAMHTKLASTASSASSETAVSATPQIEDLDLDDLDLDFDTSMVFHTDASENTKNTDYKDDRIDRPNRTKKLILKSDIAEEVLFSYSRSKNITDFILDTAATKHIIVDRSLFQSFRECNKSVSWGKIKTITVRGIEYVWITFSDTNKRYPLKNSLYMPELGINLISQSELSDIFTGILNNKFCKVAKG